MSRRLFTKLFWLDTFERAVSTSAQAVLTVTGLSGDFLGVINQGVNLKMAASAAALGFALTVLKCAAAAYKSNTDTASFTVDTKAAL